MSRFTWVADSAKLLLSDVDPRDHQFITSHERTVEGFFPFAGGQNAAIARGLAYAPYADLIWCETSKPNVEEARRFAEAIYAKFPGKMLAYNCSPSFNWNMHHEEKVLRKFQDELAAMGYKFQFITLAGFHSINAGMYDLARNYAKDGMAAYAKLQDKEAEMEKDGYKALKHQSFVGAGYFDALSNAITSGKSCTQAMKGSTEESQF